MGSIDESGLGDAATAVVGRVLVVEDVAATRNWLAATAAAAFPDAQVATAATLAAARAWLDAAPVEGAPTVALIDLGLPDGYGVSFIRDMHRRLPDATLVVTTIYDDDQHVLEAMAAGATGYLLKDRDAAEIERRLRGIAAGEVAISPVIARRILGLLRTQTRLLGAQAVEPVALTARETDVLQMIGRGLKVSEAAGALGISDQTVAGYVKAIYRKLDISSRAEAALEAARRGLT